MTATDQVRVLLVDDNQEILDRAAAMLSPAYLVVGAVKDGPAALESVRVLHPDVVVLDISMPGMSGLEVAGRLRRAGSNVQIVFLTIHDDEELVLAAQAAGGIGYVAKTLLPSDLVMAINEACAGRPVRVADAMNSEEQRRLANRKLIEAHETERASIGRALHDDIGQRMAVTTMDLDVLARALPLPTTDARIRIRALSDRTLALAKDIQALSHRLYPSKLDLVGVVAAAAGFCREVAERRNVDVAFSHDNGVPEFVPAGVALSVFRVLQEAVTNAVTHAGVRHVAVALRGSPDEIQLEIVDAGIGFDVDVVLSGRGLGLVGMQERMRAIGGELVIQSRPIAGTSIRARVPLSGSDPSLATE